MVIDVGAEFSPFLSGSGSPVLGDIEPHILERALQIAMDLAREGREGRPVGAIYVLGDYEQVVKSCQQMVINPFRGYRDDEKSIMDPFLEETLKEFATIDGAIVIRGDGVVMSAGVFLRPGKAAEKLLAGLGARHTAAAAITTTTAAVMVPKRTCRTLPPREALMTLAVRVRRSAPEGRKVSSRSTPALKRFCGFLKLAPPPPRSRKAESSGFSSEPAGRTNMGRLSFSR